MKIELRTNIKEKTIHLINTYAPHMGYARSERDAYWSEIKFILNKIPRKDIIIWTTDNNGQIARPPINNDRGEGIKNEAHIGQWHYAVQTEKGNGEKLVKTLHKFELTATNTIHTPKNNDKKRLVTWTSGDGKIEKQIDYIMISKNISTWLNYSKAKGTANMNHTNQHNIICMELRVKLKAQENNHPLHKHINFNINHLRENTEKLLIGEDDEARKAIENHAKQLQNAQTITRTDNNRLWNMIEQALQNNKQRTSR